MDGYTRIVVQCGISSGLLRRLARYYLDEKSFVELIKALPEYSGVFYPFAMIKLHKRGMSTRCSNILLLNKQTRYYLK